MAIQLKQKKLQVLLTDAENQGATTFWDFVKQDPLGNYFSPGYQGDIYQTGNIWNYLSISVSPYSGSVAPIGPQSQYTSRTTASNAMVSSPGIIPPNTGINIRKEYARDVNKPVKGNAAITMPQGAIIPTIQIDFMIWTAPQWGVFQQFVNNYVPTPKKVPQAYKAYHPVLALHNINAIQIWGLEGPKPGPVPRSKIFTFICTEWVTPETTIIVPSAPDTNVYSPLYSGSTKPSAAQSSTPGNTNPPAQPTGLPQ